MLFLILLLAIFTFLFQNFYWKRRHLPPGPTPWPIIGNVLTLSRSKRFEDKFAEWSQQYGPTFTYWLGGLPVVAVCDYNDMIKYFVKHADIFSDRRNEHVLRVRKGEYGIIATNGALWREHRRFALKVLRDFGLGKNQMEERILLELNDLLEKVEKVVGPEEVDFFRFTDIAVGSVINAVVSGHRFTEERKDEFYRMKDLTKSLMSSVRDFRANLARHNGWLQRIPTFKQKGDQIFGYFNQISDYLGGQIDQHFSNNDYSNDLEPNDFIDAYLLERQRRIDQGEEGTFCLQQLQMVMFDLWVAGQETTSSTITWIIAYLIRHPEVQEKLQEELDSVIGSKRIIRNSDRPDLPYTNAVIMESQRCSNIVAQNIPRQVNQDVEVNGYMLKKGTVIVPQISALHRNSKVFPHPERFNPDRFIDENGKLKHIDEFIPFSLGKRICLGEGLAKMELFIFTANLFNQFKFSAGNVPLVLEKVSGSSMFIKPYKCVVEKR